MKNISDAAVPFKSDRKMQMKKSMKANAGGYNLNFHPRLLCNSFASTTESNSKHISFQKSFTGAAYNNIEINSSQAMFSFSKNNNVSYVPPEDKTIFLVYSSFHIQTGKNLYRYNNTPTKIHDEAIHYPETYSSDKNLISSSSEVNNKQVEAAKLIQKKWKTFMRKTQVKTKLQDKTLLSDKSDRSIANNSLYQMILQRRNSSKTEMLKEFQNELHVNNILLIQKYVRFWLKKKRTKSAIIIQKFFRQNWRKIQEKKRKNALNKICALVMGYKLRKILKFKKLKGLCDQIYELNSYLQKTKNDVNLYTLISKQLFSAKTQYSAYIKFFSNEGRWVHNIAHQKLVTSAIRMRGTLTVEELRKSFGPLQEIKENEDSPTKKSISPRYPNNKNIITNNSILFKTFQENSKSYQARLSLPKIAKVQQKDKRSIVIVGEKKFKTNTQPAKPAKCLNGNGCTILKKILETKFKKNLPTRKNSQETGQLKLAILNSLQINNKKNNKKSIKPKIQPKQYNSTPSGLKRQTNASILLPPKASSKKNQDNITFSPRTNNQNLFTDDLTGIIERQYSVMIRDPVWNIIQKRLKQNQKIDSVISELKINSLFCQFVSNSNRDEVHNKLQIDYEVLKDQFN